jgi:hypothetical protein
MHYLFIVSYLSKKYKIEVTDSDWEGVNINYVYEKSIKRTFYKLSHHFQNVRNSFCVAQHNI